MKNQMKLGALMVPLLIVFSCTKIPEGSVEGLCSCPPCVVECPKCERLSAPTCNEVEIENCIETCVDENNCFFAFGSWTTCFKNCGIGCLDKLGCDWRN